MSAFYYCIHKKYRKTFDVHRALGIEDWPDEILNDPNKFIHHVDKEILSRDTHTALQSNLLPANLNALDFIGQMENMEEVEEKISQVVNNEVKFTYVMKKQGRDYFPLKVDANRFNKLFLEDYEMLDRFYTPLNTV